jgi:Mechanosensitive ion channel
VAPAPIEVVSYREMLSTRTTLGRLLVALIALGATVGTIAVSGARADEEKPKTASDAQSTASHGSPRSPEQVLASLNRAMAWYRQARTVMRSIDGTGIFASTDEQTAVRLLGRAFDAARAQAALLDRETDAPASADGRRRERRKKLEVTIRQDEQEVANLRARLREAEPGQRPALERASVAANNRLELNRARLEFLTQLRELDSSRSGADDNLENQIEAPPQRATSGTWARIQHLLAVRRSRSDLYELEAATNGLVRGVDEDIAALRASMKPMMARLRVLAGAPTDSGISLKDSQREFRDLLERRKLLAAVVLPLREESALARRYAADLKGWNEVIDRESRQALQGLALDLVGVVGALAVIFVGGVLWRVGVIRYVTDATRRRLLLTIRRVVVTVAVALVLIFHFTSEMTALVTALGFAAAGIAFALQNVILAVAGYFMMVAPNGIRVGDRVSLQGPFGYVHGEVTEIGFVRIKLQELAGDPLRPSGRIVVFPNSVVFTGTFFKDPPVPAS